MRYLILALAFAAAASAQGFPCGIEVGCAADNQCYSCHYPEYTCYLSNICINCLTACENLAALPPAQRLRIERLSAESHARGGLTDMGRAWRTMYERLVHVSVPRSGPPIGHPPIPIARSTTECGKAKMEASLRFLRVPVRAR